MRSHRIFDDTRLRLDGMLAQMYDTAEGGTSTDASLRGFFETQGPLISSEVTSTSDPFDCLARRTALADAIVHELCSHLLSDTINKEVGITLDTFAILACGSYGRGEFNAGSNLDLTLLHRGITQPVELPELLLKSLSFIGYRVRIISIGSADEVCRLANQEHRVKSSLIDARFVIGNRVLFEQFRDMFQIRCLDGQELDFLGICARENRARHRRHGNTPHLQEPNVKESCGGLRDYQSLLWVLRVLRKSTDLSSLVALGELTEHAYSEMEDAFSFLVKVRDVLHYEQEGTPGDILTLRLQGIVATKLGFPGQNIIRRSEAFMREYYRLTRALFYHSTSLMQAFRLEVGATADQRPADNSTISGEFDGFFSKDRLIYPVHEGIFQEDPVRMMRFFLHTQRRNLSTSPEIRRLFKKEWGRIDGNFRRNRAVRDIFEEILQSRGQVSRVLRRMHRVGFLGRYLPEFGQLTDLVQHEFFHRYSADEHTLRCIDILDGLILSEDPRMQTFRRIFQNIEDPVALYVALLMHDTGRSENVQHHEDASVILAGQVCRRLGFRGDRMRLILFLVDHHLSFWRTATTTDINDLHTITQFAETVKSASWLDALYLFTYVDSKGTNDEAWTDWKASLMAQLHRRTSGFFADRIGFCDTFVRPLAELKHETYSRLSVSYHREIDALFSTTPERYFHHRNVTSIVRHVRLFRRFLLRLRKPSNESLVPVLRWEARPNEGYSLLEVAGWNRRYLLAKIAGALASENLNILSADLYSRSDDLVLNIFRICTQDFRPVTDTMVIDRIDDLLTQGFLTYGTGEQFRSLIDSRRTLADIPEGLADFVIPKRVFLSNELDPSSTVIEIQTPDRLGLLYDLFTQLGKLDIDVLNARISTQAGAAIDRFYIVDAHSGGKILDEPRLRRISDQIAECLHTEHHP